MLLMLHQTTSRRHFASLSSHDDHVAANATQVCVCVCGAIVNKLLQRRCIIAESLAVMMHSGCMTRLSHV